MHVAESYTLQLELAEIGSEGTSYHLCLRLSVTHALMPYTLSSLRSGIFMKNGSPNKLTATAVNESEQKGKLIENDGSHPPKTRIYG